MSDINDHFEVLRKIQKRPETTQRELAEELGFSLGKLNYCMKALQDKGLITIQNFRRNPKKINYLYTLTAKGNEHKFNLTLKFMKKKYKNIMN